MTFEELANADAFTTARLVPAIDVSRTELEGDTYFNGNSRDLAGRGVYGDYTLFIPAEVLSASETEEGLDLDAIADILLRIDYVSVVNSTESLAAAPPQIPPVFGEARVSGATL